MLLLPAFGWPGGSPEHTGIIGGDRRRRVLRCPLAGGVPLDHPRHSRTHPRPDHPTCCPGAGARVQPAGWVLYLVLRPRITLAEIYERQLEEEALLQELTLQLACPQCGAEVLDTYVACPQLRHSSERALPGLPETAQRLLARLSLVRRRPTDHADDRSPDRSIGHDAHAPQPPPRRRPGADGPAGASRNGKQPASRTAESGRGGERCLTLPAAGARGRPGRGRACLRRAAGGGHASPRIGCGPVANKTLQLVSPARNRQPLR